MSVSDPEPIGERPAGGESIRVAVVGGGCAAMAAAWELSRPEHAGRYQVTVYQQGWRLGGKGASGRGASGRIEEHGLHLWMGWYENAFRLMRECYDELARDPQTCPIATWRDAFEPDDHLGVVERLENGEWLHWIAHLPPAPGLPGDPYPEGHRWSVVHYLLRSAALVRTLLSTLGERAGDAERTTGPEAAPRSADPVVRWLSRLTRYGGLTSLALLAQAASALELGLRRLSPGGAHSLQRLIEAIAANAREQIDDRITQDPQAGRLWTILDLTLATMRGIIRFGLLDDERGFDAIDEYDCREWLLLNGASRAAVDSAFVKGLYDLGFSYEDGDPGRPRIAAGQSLRATIRAFFTYRRSFFWRMQAGMGDIVFAPLYEAMKRRGVRFEFFHRLENVGLSREEGAEPHVAELLFDVQARIRDGGAYRPLVDVGGLPCWPSEPDWSQLEDGDWLEQEGRRFESFWEPPGRDPRRLRVGEDFDLVVLGVGLGAIPHLCRELVERDPKWCAMVEHCKTVATQAFQVWLEPTMEELGWSDGPVSISGFVEPFDTWADMRHLIAREAWERRPGALAYFCSVLPDLEASPERGDAAYPTRQSEQVRRNAIHFLDHDVRHLWPRANRPSGGFRWEALSDPRRSERGHGAHAPRDEKAFDSQFWIANVNPSDRYALSLPGSLVHRISPLDDAYDNLAVCGDWTACGFNAGCVESAVMSGLLAAHAISLSPALEDIIGYDHP